MGVDVAGEAAGPAEDDGDDAVAKNKDVNIRPRQRRLRRRDSRSTPMKTLATM